MSGFSREDHDLATRFFRQLQADNEIRDAREEAEAATQWVIVLLDLEFGRMSVYGDSYMEPAPALERAAAIDKAVNQAVEGTDEPGWRAIVLPLQPMTGWDRVPNRRMKPMADRDDAARAAATRLFPSDDVDFDHKSRVVHLDEEGAEEGAAWIRAWVFVSADEIEKELVKQDA